MAENKTSEAQREASRKWEQKNRKKATVDGYRRTAKMFIKKHATLENLEELKDLIKNREEELDEIN